MQKPHLHSRHPASFVPSCATAAFTSEAGEGMRRSGNIPFSLVSRPSSTCRIYTRLIGGTADRRHETPGREKYPMDS